MVRDLLMTIFFFIIPLGLMIKIFKKEFKKSVDNKIK